MDLTVGQVIGDYEVLGVLGSGGMGKVYKVQSIVSQRIEAMKVLLPDLNAQPELAERFLREIRISAGLEHPNIASLRTAQRVGNQLLMVMEYIDGVTLGELMEKTRLTLDRSFAYISQALSALEYAHGRGVIHRDIKPGNIMITAAGQAKLMDFGIARLDTDAKLTKTGVMVGSVHYMSPEQIEGHELDVRSDIYSLGVTFYEMVTGKRPFGGDSEYQVMAAHLKGAPQPPRELNQALPVAVNEVILTALARDMGSRFASAKAMQNAVMSIMQRAEMPTVAYAPQTGPPAAVPKSHRTLYMLAGSVATLAVLIGAAVEIPNFRRARANDEVRVQQRAPVSQVPNVSSPPSAIPAQIEPAPQPAAVVPKDNQPVSQAPRKTAGHVKVRETQAARAPDEAITPELTQAPAQQPTETPVQTDTAELAALQDRMMLMDARVAAVRSSLQNLKNEQAASGLGLRSDMVASEQRLLTHMDGAESSLKNSDAAAARKWLDAAETELGKLETFLGK